MRRRAVMCCVLATALTSRALKQSSTTQGDVALDHHHHHRNHQHRHRRRQIDIEQRHLQDGGGGAAPTPSPSTSTPIVDCSGGGTLEVYTSGDRLYVSNTDGIRGGCITLSDIYAARLSNDGIGRGPLYILDGDDQRLDGPDQTITGRWLLYSDLYITSGITLLLWGTSFGGDVDVLRLQSSSSMFVNLRGYGGNLSLFHTTVTSWNSYAGAVQEKYSDGRSYISCVSEKLTGETCEGKAQKEMGECRMDVISSEIGYLGWPDSESYGLSWKVRGFCTDLSNEDLFDDVQVYGDILDSDIHHNYYGMYSYGHEGGIWSNNLMHDNHQYGFDPHDDSDDLVISFNTVYNNKNHGIIASKRCTNVIIHDNEVFDGEMSGIYLHRSSDNAKVYNNYVHGNLHAGLSIMETDNCEIYDNVFEKNTFGLRIILGGNDNLIHDNVFDQCSSYGLLTFQGSDTPMESNGRPSRNQFYKNVVSNTELGLKFNDGDNNQIYDNTFTGTEQFRFYDSKAVEFKHNTYPENACFVDQDTSLTKDSEVPQSCW